MARTRTPRALPVLSVLFPLVLVFPVEGALAEVLDGGVKGVGEVFAVLDLDGNGWLDLAEYRALRASEFGALDENGDGVIEEGEFIVRYGGITGEGAERVERAWRNRLMAVDLDGDGRITRAEDEDYGDFHFRFLDQDRDGKVVPEELGRLARRG